MTFAVPGESVRIVDAHVHVASSDQTAFPLAPTGVGPAWFEQNPFTAEDVADAMRGAQVSGAVLVQSYGAYGHDCSYIREAGHTWPESFSCVVSIGPTVARPSAVVAGYLDDPAVCGFRLLPQFEDDLVSPSCRSLWRIVGESGLTVDVVSFEPWRLLPLLDQLSATRVVAYGSARLQADWSLMAQFPNVFVKLTSSTLKAASEYGHAPAEVLESYVELFGSKRVVWGSNAPVSLENSSYSEVVRQAILACSSLTSNERAAVLGGTARRLWGPAPGGS